MPRTRSDAALRLVAGTLIASAFLGLAAACTPDPFPGAALAGEELRLQVLHTNDFHGRLAPQVEGAGAFGGSALLAAHFDSARVRFDGPTVLLSAGDVMQGTAVSNMAWGRPAIELYNRKGYDAAALGNHEFDWGLDTLRARVSESAFPWLGANVYLAGTDEHPEWVHPYLVIERDGARVGVVGVALATTPEVVMAGRTDGLEFRGEAEALDRYVPELRALGVDFVIAVGHVGAVCAEPGIEPDELSNACESRGVRVLEGLSHPPDLFLGGHTHLRNLTDVAGIPLVQNPAYSRTFSVTHVVRREGEPRARVTHRELRAPADATADPDTAVARVVAEWHREVEPLLAQPVATLAEEFSNEDRRPVENTAGNLLADAQRWATGAAIGLVNNGSLRRGLPEGPVDYGTLYEFQPFQNDLVVLRLDGALLREILEFGLTDDGEPWIHVSGVRVEFDPAAARGDRIARIVRDDGSGAEITPGDEVTIGTTEFVATGGDGFEMLLGAELTRTGWIDLDALAEYLRSRADPVRAPALGRWIRSAGCC